MCPIPIGNDPAGSTIPVLVVPSASQREVAGIHGDRLRIRVIAPPEKGRADKEVATARLSYSGYRPAWPQGVRVGANCFFSKVSPRLRCTGFFQYTSA